MQNKKWLSFLLALVVSVGMWVYVVAVENPEGEDVLYNIPVVFSGEDLLREDYDLVIVDDNVTSSGVNLTFSGKRTDLKKLSELKSELKVSIDVTRIRKENKYTYSYNMSNITLPASVASDSVTLVARAPGSVSLTVEKISARTVPVKALVNVELAEGYIQDRIVQDYDEIIIEGPAALIEQVDHAQIVLERENVDKTLSATLPITLIDVNDEPVVHQDISCDVSEIQVTLPVLLTKEVNLDVGFIAGGGAALEDVTYKIEPPVLTLTGDASVLQGLNTIKLSNIDLASLMTNSEDISCQIPIPEGCTNVGGETEAVISVKIANKAIKSFKATNIQIVNPPQGLDAVSKTTILWVTVRGDEDLINQLSEENIRVVADMAETIIPENSTSVSVPVQIFVDGYENVGAIGPQYNIVVGLS